MTEEFHGLVTGVREERLGDVLTVAAVAGDTVLHVNDVADFDEDGGYFRFPGVFVPLTTIPVVLAYASVDDDASTIILTAPLSSVVAAPVDATVEVWDFVNTQPVTTYKAVVDCIDGFDGDPVEAVVDQSLAHALAQSMRDGAGESVSLERDGSEMRLVKIHGRKNALASLQYLQGGLTTRSAEDQAGVDVVGADSGSPGINAYGAGGVPTVVIDATTGNASFIGELGTALPGNEGIFLYSPTFTRFGSTVTHPVIQLNTGATRDQPSIQADSAGDGSGIYVFSGAGTGQRESQIVADNGRVYAGVESAVNDGIYQGAYFYLDRDTLTYRTDFKFGGSNLSAQLFAQDPSIILGYRDSGGTNLRGVAIARTGGVSLLGGSAAQVVTVDAAAYQAIQASAFTVSSDPAVKADLTDAPDALAIIAAAPAKRWRYKTDPKATKRIGPMADDLPKWLVDTTAEDAPGGKHKTVDLARMNGVLWHAVSQLAEANTAQQQQIDDLAARLERLESAQAGMEKEHG